MIKKKIADACVINDAKFFQLDCNDDELYSKIESLKKEVNLLKNNTDKVYKEMYALLQNIEKLNGLIK